MGLLQFILPFGLSFLPFGFVLKLTSTFVSEMVMIMTFGQSDTTNIVAGFITKLPISN